MPDNLPVKDTITDPPSAPEPIHASQWREHIPADLKDKGYWKPIENNTLSDVLKGYGHAQERLGKSISIPDKPDDKEGWDKMHERLGRPKTAKEYKYDIPNIEGVKWEDGAWDRLNDVSHGLGLSNDQAAGLAKWLSTDIGAKVKRGFDEQDNEAAVVETKLKREMGTNYEMNVALARRAAQMYFGDEAAQGILDNMEEPVIRGLVKLGAQLAEDKAFGANPVEMQGAINADEALRRIAAVNNDRAHPYWGSENLEATKLAVADMENYHKIAYPESSVSR